MEAVAVAILLIVMAVVLWKAVDLWLVKPYVYHLRYHRWLADVRSEASERGVDEFTVKEERAMEALLGDE